MTPLAFFLFLTGHQSASPPTCGAVSASHCLFLNTEEHNSLHVPEQARKLTCPRATICTIYHEHLARYLCMSVCHMPLRSKRPILRRQGSGFFLSDAYSGAWLSSWAFLSFISGPYCAINSTWLLSWAQSLQVRDYIFLDLVGNKSCPKHTRIWVK